MSAGSTVPNVLLYDANGNPIVFGGATSAVSLPVVIASDQAAVAIKDGGGSITVDAAALPLPTGAATESTLAALNINAGDIETILVAIRDTAGVKKIADQLPAGTNNIGDVDVVSSALPTGAATEATVATLATQATAALIKAKTDNLDVLLSTRATEATVATLATQATAALIKAKTDNLDVLLSTRATESTVAAINTATGATGDADTALTVIGRLKQLLTRLPAALISGRLDINNGAWLGSTAPTIGQKTMANSIPIVFPSDQVLAVTTTPSAATPSLAFGDIALAAVTTAALYRTPYTEQSANFTGSIASASASDAAAGTGARTVRIFYVDATGATAGFEDVTLNGVTFVNLVTATKCFIEKIEVLTVGSTGSNVGILTLKAGLAGAGATVITIGATDNRTFLAHHHVVTGKTANVTGVLIGSNVTNTAGSCIGFLRAKVIGAAAAVEKQVSDGITVAGLDSSVFRSYGSQIQVVGPARITLYVTTATGSAFNYRGSFDSYDA